MKRNLSILACVAVAVAACVIWKALAHTPTQAARPISYQQILAQVQANDATQASFASSYNAAEAKETQLGLARKNQELDQRGIKGTEKRRLLAAEAARLRGPHLSVIPSSDYAR